MFEALEKLVSDFSMPKKKKKGMKETTITIASTDDEPSIAERINFGGQFPDKKKKKKNSYYESGGLYE